MTDSWVLMPSQITPEMIAAGGHANSEYLNDNAPLGEALYALPIPGVYAALIAARPTPPDDLVEAIAREIDPAAFMRSTLGPFPRSPDGVRRATATARRILALTGQGGAG